MSKNKGGRPTIYTKDIEDQIIDRITSGESVSNICRDPAMPGKTCLFSWLSKNDEFANRYAQALQNRTHLKAEERHEVIENAISGLAELPKGVNANVFATLIKEKVRAIEWDAERLAANKYKVKSDQIDLGEAQPLTINFEVAEPVSDITVTNAKT